MTSIEFSALLQSKRLEESRLAGMLVEALTKEKKKIATAESCTGGLIAQKITAVPGASEVFDCGVCAYANRIKEQLLQVGHETLAVYGAVSEQTARQMAQGVRLLSGADVAISATGIAGPAGGTKEKPVGLVFIGCSTKNSTTVIRAMLADGGHSSRESIRQTASSIALYSAIIALKE